MVHVFVARGNVAHCVKLFQLVMEDVIPSLTKKSSIWMEVTVVKHHVYRLICINVVLMEAILVLMEYLLGFLSVEIQSMVVGLANLIAGTQRAAIFHF